MVMIIHTKFLGWTNTKPNRIKAWVTYGGVRTDVDSKKSVIVGIDSNAENEREIHRAGVKALDEKFDIFDLGTDLGELPTLDGFMYFQPEAVRKVILGRESLFESSEERRSWE
jgi:hypothetical protein